MAINACGLVVAIQPRARSYSFGVNSATERALGMTNSGYADQQFAHQPSRFVRSAD